MAGGIWEGYDRGVAANRAESLGALQQASAVQGILAQQQQMATRQEALGRERELRGILGGMTPEQQADPTFIRGVMLKYATPHDALASLSRNPLEGASDIRKLIAERDAAVKAGNTDVVKLYNARIAKLNQTEGAMGQEDMNYVLDVRNRTMRGEQVSPEEQVKAQFIMERMTQPRVLPDGSIVQPKYGDQFNPAKNFGLGALSQPQPTLGALSQPAMDANGQPVPATAGVPVQMANNEAEALRMLQGATGPMRVQLREPGAVAPTANPRVDIAPGPRPLSDFSDIKTDKSGRSFGFNKRTGQIEEIPGPRLQTEAPRRMSADERKSINETDAAIQGGKQVLKSIDEALSINNKAMGFYGAGAVSTAASYMPETIRPKIVDATEQLHNLIIATALPQLKAIFGSQPSNKENQLLLDLAGSIDKNPAVREGIFKRAKEAAEARMAHNQDKLKELRTGTFYQAGATESFGEPAPADAGPARVRRYNPATGKIE